MEIAMGFKLKALNIPAARPILAALLYREDLSKKIKNNYYL
jgi:hypothetical protein